MAETYSVIAQLSAVDKNFTSVFSKANGTAESFASKMKSGLGMGVAIAAGQKMFGVLENGFRSVASHTDAAISRLDTLNNYPKVMESLGYTTKAAQASIDKLDKGINGLPTTMDGIAQSAQMLTATMGNLDKGTKSAVALNDMFLAGGQGADAASRALTQYNQILAKGKVDQQSWNTMVEVAPAQMNQLAESLLGAGKNQKDLYESLQKGTISIDDFNNAIIKMDKQGSGKIKSFHDQALASTQGIGTAIQNMKTAVTKNLANIFSGVDNALKGSIFGGGIADIFGMAKAGIDSVFSSMYTTNKKHEKVLTGSAKRIVNSVGKVFSTLYKKDKDGNWALTDKATEALGKVKKAISTFGSYVGKGVGLVKRFFAVFKETGALTAVKTAVMNIAKAFKHVASALSSNGGSIEGIADLLGNLVTMLANAASAAAKFISKLPPGVINGIATAIVSAAAGFAVFHKGISMVTKVSGKVKAIKGIFSGVKKGASEGLGGAAQEVKGGVSKIADIIRSLGDLIQSAGSGIATAVKGIGTGISTAFKGISSGITTIIKGIGTTVATIFKGIGTGIATAAKGIGTGLSTMFQGIGKGLALVSPVQLLALGAAILIVCAGFTLLATQGQGVATILNAIGSVLTSVISTVIGTVAQAIVTVAGVVPVICSGLAQLAPLVVAVGEAIGAAAPGISAFGDAIGSIIESVGNAVATIAPAIAEAIATIIQAITPIIPTVANACATIIQAVTPVIPLVTSGIAQIISAITPIVPNIQAMVEAVAPVIMKLADAFVQVVQQISPVLDSLSNLIDTCFTGISDTVTSIGDAISKVVKTIGDSISGVLDSVAGIFDSIGNAALNAGRGFDLLAGGIKILVDLKLGDLIATLKKTADGISDIAANSKGLPELGQGFAQLGGGIQKAAIFGNMAGIAFQRVSDGLIPMSVAIEGLPASLTACATALQSFATNLAVTGAGLIASVASFAMISTTVGMTRTALFAMTAVAAAAAGIVAGLSASATSAASGLNKVARSGARVSSKLSAIPKAVASAKASLNGLGAIGTASIAILIAAITAGGAKAKAVMTNIGSAMTTALGTGLLKIGLTATNAMKRVANATKTGGAQAKAAATQVANNINTALKTGLSKLYNTATSAMSKFASGIRSGGSSAVSAANSVASSVSSAMSGASSGAYSAGQNIGQGLANGIRSMIPAVRAASKALADAADRTIIVTAKIGSPSKKTFKSGKWIGLGLAKGMASESDSVKQASMNLATDAFKSLGKAKAGKFQKKAQDVAKEYKTDLNDAMKTSLKNVKKTLKKRTDSAIAQTASYKAYKKAHKRVADLEKKVRKASNATAKASAQKELKTAKDREKKLKKAAKSTSKRIKKFANPVTEKLYDAYATKLKKGTNKAVKKATEKIEELGKKYQAQWNDIIEKRSNFYDKLSDYGSLFTADNYGFIALKDFKAAESEVKEYSKNMEELKKRGLNKDLLQEITELDTASGLQYTRELLKKSDKDLKAYGDQYASFIKTASKASETFYADQLSAVTKNYQAAVKKADAELQTELKKVGENAMNGLITGMVATSKSLKKKSKKLANYIVTIFKKELKIHSPSKVMASLGNYTGEGFANGMAESARMIESAARDLFTIPEIAADSVRISAPDLSSDSEYGVQAAWEVTVPVNLDGKEIARVTAPYTEAELNRRNLHAQRKLGYA